MVYRSNSTISRTTSRTRASFASTLPRSSSSSAISSPPRDSQGGSPCSGRKPSYADFHPGGRPSVVLVHKHGSSNIMSLHLIRASGRRLHRRAAGWDRQLSLGGLIKQDACKGMSALNDTIKPLSNKELQIKRIMRRRVFPCPSCGRTWMDATPRGLSRSPWSLRTSSCRVPTAGRSRSRWT